MGNSQSYLRAQYSNSIERYEFGLQFGFYFSISKTVVFVGSIFYGVASDYLKSQKIPLLFILVSRVIFLFGK